MSKTPKTYIVKWTRYRTTETTERFIQGTTEQIARYCGNPTAKNVRSALSKWQKELDRRYECTYTRVYVEMVETAPEGAKVDVLS